MKAKIVNLDGNYSALRKCFFRIIAVGFVIGIVYNRIGALTAI